jgi:glycosyltransferase involved in cell wall biosynthesis
VWLSILTPSRNYRRYLPDALKSVELQVEDEVEHVVVDGASTDGTIDLLQEWSERIRFVSEPDEGQSDALNRAAAMSKGEWLGWLNADEFYLPGAFTALRMAARQLTDADVIYGDCCFVDQDGRLLRLVPQHPFDPRVLRWYGPYISSCATFIRATVLPDRGWDEALRRIMDWDLYLELYRRGVRFAYLPVPISVFRVHREQVTAVRDASWEGERMRVRGRHGLATRSRTARALYFAGLVQHGLGKLTSGAYQRQLRVKGSLQGADLRWFASAEANRNVEQLLRLASRSAD